MEKFWTRVRDIFASFWWFEVRRISSARKP
jgi:hypothetical protein